MTSYIITTLKTLLIFIVNQSVTSFYTTDIDLFFKISFWQGLNERKTISLCKAVVEQVTTTQSLLSICCLLLRYCIFNLLCQSSVSVVSRWVVFFGGFLSCLVVMMSRLFIIDEMFSLCCCGHCVFDIYMYTYRYWHDFEWTSASLCVSVLYQSTARDRSVLSNIFHFIK